MGSSCGWTQNVAPDSAHSPDTGAEFDPSCGPRPGVPYQAGVWGWVMARPETRPQIHDVKSAQHTDPDLMRWISYSSVLEGKDSFSSTHLLEPECILYAEACYMQENIDSSRKSLQSMCTSIGRFCDGFKQTSHFSTDTVTRNSYRQQKE